MSLDRTMAAAVGSVSLILVAACQGVVTVADRGGNGGTPTIPVPTADAGAGDGAVSPLTGREIYAAACAPCHGVEGQGTPLAPELQHPVRPFATWVVRNGAPGVGFANKMAAYPEGLISAQQLDEIWDYLAGFPQPTTGKDLYFDYCATCHGVDARGAPVGKDISDKRGNDLLEKVRSGAGGSNYAARARYMPGWSATQLTDAEVALISQHIATLP